MKGEVLDIRKDKAGTCYLCKITLEEYLNSLPDTYQDYDIQREIVSNVYLDRLVETVLSKSHIPPIVLVADRKHALVKSDAIIVSANKFKILDGLQRTFRLKAIRETINYSIKHIRRPTDPLGLNSFRFSRQFSAELRKFDSTTDVLRAVLEARVKSGSESVLDTFRSNEQWFEIWTGLSPDEEVRKMLTLNAGHKPVKTRHQLELLFLNLLPILRADDATSFELVREKEISSTQFSKARSVGSFHFAHIITSLLSLHAGKPIAPSTSLIESIQGSDIEVDEYVDFTSPRFLKSFISFLVNADETISEAFPAEGVLWVGREVTLAGLFGAIGAHAREIERSPSFVMAQLREEINAHPKYLNLVQFEFERNSVDLSKVNIGNVNRNAVFNAMRSFLVKPKKLDWAAFFKGTRQ